MAVDGTDARLKCTPDTNDTTCVRLILEALRNVLTSPCAASEAYEELTTGTAGHKWANGADQVTQEVRRGTREATRKRRQPTHPPRQRERATNYPYNASHSRASPEESSRHQAGTICIQCYVYACTSAPRQRERATNCQSRALPQESSRHQAGTICIQCYVYACTSAG